MKTAMLMAVFLCRNFLAIMEHKDFSHKKKVIIIGGGASGFFLAANLDASRYSVTILEKTTQVLGKVKISGGGRCNVTHDEKDPLLLSQNYPRGQKELRALFHQFSPEDMMQWLLDKGVPVHTEKDGRVFPKSNTSQSIIDCLMHQVALKEVEVKTEESVKALKKTKAGWKVETSKAVYQADFVVCAAGSSSQIWKILAEINYTIVPPVPSLFTFKINHPFLEQLPGTSFLKAIVKIPSLKKENQGAMMITHWGLSGPAVLVLSAWQARALAELNYQFEIRVNFLAWSMTEAEAFFAQQKKESPKNFIGNIKPEGLTKKFWLLLLDYLDISSEKRWADISKKEVQLLIEHLTAMEFSVVGKSTHKDEFVTAGGVSRKEINWKTMESKLHEGLFFSGEVIDVDAVTGGFNFQACWSEAWCIAEHLNSV